VGRSPSSSGKRLRDGCAIDPPSCGHEGRRANRPQQAQRPARGSVSPVAPRRCPVAVRCPPADLRLPCAALHVSGVSYENGLRQYRREFKRLSPSRAGDPAPTVERDRTFYACGRSRRNGGRRSLRGTAATVARCVLNEAQARELGIGRDPVRSTKRDVRDEAGLA
jgi:hypothetical protein